MFDTGDSPPSRARLAAIVGRLSGPPPAPFPPLDLLPAMALARGRVHEVTGAARQVLAAALAGRAQAEGPVLWLRPGWGGEGLCPQGLAAFADPGALVMVGCRRAPDVLWAAEEALQSGAVALVLAELAAAPDLRQIRRLHLAAAEGVARATGSSGRNSRAPLGILMMQERAESRVAGVESRWALHPVPVREGGAEWRLERLLARDAPPGEWPLRLGRSGLEMG
jgi:protein ImuA